MLVSHPLLFFLFALAVLVSACNTWGVIRDYRHMQDSRYLQARLVFLLSLLALSIFVLGMILTYGAAILERSGQFT